MNSLLNQPWTLVRHLADWPVASQQVARRNALIASTQLADRRRERHDVDEFLDSYLRARTAASEETALVVG